MCEDPEATLLWFDLRESNDLSLNLFSSSHFAGEAFPRTAGGISNLLSIRVGSE